MEDRSLLDIFVPHGFAVYIEDLLIKGYKFLIFENRAIVTVVQYTYLNKISTIIIIIYYYVPCQIALVLYINLFNYQYPQEQKYQAQVQSQIHKFL